MREILPLVVVFAVCAACMAFALPGKTAATSVDEYISTSRGEVKPVFDPRFPADPRSSRKLWESRKESTTEQEVDAENIPETKENIAGASEVKHNISGKISFVLKDITTKNLDLYLYQLDGVVFGHGNISEGNTSQQVSAIGDVNGAALELDVITTDLVYRIKVDGSRSPMTGSFTAYRSDATSWPGVVYQ